MITTIRELRDLIADNCDFSQPLRIFAHDVGKKADKHSTVRVDEGFPTKITITHGMYDASGVIEFAHDPEGKVLMPKTFVEALDDLLEGEPKATIGWTYFFYYPLDYKGLFGKVKKIKECLLDTNSIKDIYLLEGQSNVLIVEAEYGIGSFDR